MADNSTSISRRSALQQVADPLSAQSSTISSKTLRITEYRPQIIAQINGATAPSTLQIALSSLGLSADELPAEQFDSGRAYCAGDTTILWNGPGMWLLVCEDSNRTNTVNELNMALQNSTATVTDLSHSRTILAMQGESLLDFLSSGCPIDLDNCPAHACFSTQFGHFNILLHLKDSQHANMYVYRSFGQALWEHCQHTIEEF